MSVLRKESKQLKKELMEKTKLIRDHNKYIVFVCVCVCIISCISFF